jgi:hypothetical protein
MMRRTATVIPARIPVVQEVNNYSLLLDLKTARQVGRYVTNNKKAAEDQIPLLFSVVSSAIDH